MNNANPRSTQECRGSAHSPTGKRRVQPRPARGPLHNIERKDRDGGSGLERQNLPSFPLSHSFLTSLTNSSSGERCPLSFPAGSGGAGPAFPSGAPCAPPRPAGGRRWRRQRGAKQDNAGSARGTGAGPRGTAPERAGSQGKRPRFPPAVPGLLLPALGRRVGNLLLSPQPRNRSLQSVWAAGGGRRR